MGLIAIYAVLLLNLLFALFFSQNFCHNLRVFMWRKIEPKSIFVEKKWQIFLKLQKMHFDFPPLRYKVNVVHSRVKYPALLRSLLCPWPCFAQNLTFRDSKFSITTTSADSFCIYIKVLYSAKVKFLWRIHKYFTVNFI